MNAHSRLALAVAAAALGSAAPAGCLGGHERPVLRPEVFERDPKFGERRIPATTTYTLAIPWLGEVNAVAVELTAEGFVVRDAAGVTAGDGCAGCRRDDRDLLDAPRARDDPLERGVANVMLGDGDDSIVLPPRSSGIFSSSEIDGGSGDDTIAGAGRATGGPGDDRLDAVVADGGPGNDLITAREADGGDGDEPPAPRTGSPQARGARTSGGITDVRWGR